MILSPEGNVRMPQLPIQDGLPDDEGLPLSERRDWQQATVTLPGKAPMMAFTAAHLHEALERLLMEEAITGYHFLNKGGRLRLRVGGDNAAAVELAGILDGLNQSGVILGWMAGIYKPEVTAFGGPMGMDIAHDLFCADSRAALLMVGEAGQPGSRPKETATLLLSAMLRAAQLDWFEVGDVWAKVAALRPEIALPDEAHLNEALTSMRALMRAEATAISEPEPGWDERVAAFEDTGQALRNLADKGELGRGLRSVLAHHAIFAFNRAGLSAIEQAVLASLATAVVFTSPGPYSPVTTSVGRMETTTLTAPSDDAARLRAQLVNSMVNSGRLHSSRIAEAFATVPRHLFVPKASLADAYADRPVAVKHADDGTMISAASEPTTVATMLEQLDARPGEHILEAGAATGYNAALIGHLVGPSGHVWTIDVDEDLIQGARSHLAAAEVGNVTALLGDGAAGLPGHGPYDRIVFTVGAGDVPPAILSQLAPGGRLLIPLRIRGGVQRVLAFERDGELWQTVSNEMATFMPLRKGIADDVRIITPLTPDGRISLHTYAEQDIDPEALAAALDQPAREAWSGVKFRKGSTWEWINVWLTCALPSGICRMPAAGPLVESSHVRPQFPWGTMAAVEGGTIAYLTLREGHDDEGQYWEAGAIGHGSGADDLSKQVAAQIQAWAEHRDSVPTIRMATGPQRDRLTGMFIIDKPFSRLVLDFG
jgi:protein-L-isoaspartate(D-aspartate) O-methyltransferase